MLFLAAVVARRTRSWSVVAALFICAYGALLRLDAFTGKYGALDHPAWARVVTHDIAPLARHVRPSTIVWGRIAQPYVGGDPYTYLTYAREMSSFYQPHVREPVFLALTRFALWSVDWQDAGISLASAIGSIAAIFATYLLGTALISPAGGLVAAALLAIEYDAITWAVDGWRDDTFTALFVLTAWALVRFRERASFANAVTVGLIGGAACLTRITALSFVLPALAWIVVERRADGRPRLERTTVALVLLAAVVTPYLVSCAMASGDPLLAVNYHTGYYRHAEGLPAEAPVSAADYLRTKIARHPFATLDVATTGLFVRPFETKWRIYALWSDALASTLRWAALAGMALWLFSGAGRFTLFLLTAALIPYAFTWNLGGGGEWRFTMHVYSVYLVAAVHAVFSAGAMASAALRSRGRPLARTEWRLVAVRAAAVAAIVAALTACYAGIPWLVIREAVAAGEAVNIEAGARDRVFFRRGWSPPHADGTVVARVSRAPRATVHFPLPEKRPYDISLRIDPVDPAAQTRVTVLLNRQLLGRLHLSWNPERVGAYRVSLPREWVRAGDNELELIPDVMVRAADAGPRFAWLGPGGELGLRLWYVRVLD
jgi:hypothetical protein